MATTRTGRTSPPLLDARSWTEAEDDAVRAAVASHGKRAWTDVARDVSDAFPGRPKTSKQCRARWVASLDPKITTRPWIEAEERIIRESQAEVGNKWATIAKRYSQKRKAARAKKSAPAKRRAARPAAPRRAAAPARGRAVGRAPSWGGSSVTTRRASLRSARARRGVRAAPSRRTAPTASSPVAAGTAARETPRATQAPAPPPADQSAEAAAALLSALLTPRTLADMTDGASRPPSPFAEFAYKDGAAFAVDDDDDESLRSLTPVSPASPFSASPACRPAAARPPPRPASLIKRKASPLEVLAAYAPPAAPLPPCPALEPACLPGSRTLAPASPVPLEPTEFDLPVPRDGAVRKRHVDFLMDVFPEPAPAPRFVESPVCVARWL